MSISLSRQEVIAKIVRGETDIASLEASQFTPAISPQEVAFATPEPCFAVGALRSTTDEEITLLEAESSAD